MSKGYNAAADIVQRTADGRDLNDIWAEFQETVRLLNADRQRLIDLLTFSVTKEIEDVQQFGQSGGFEVASEYGVPEGGRPDWDTYSMGYTFRWYDRASRFTWRFLGEATASQIEAIHNQVLLEDSELMFREVMKTLFRKDNRTADIKGQNFNVYSFWNGDGTVPPPYKGNTFDGSYTHFRTSGANTITSGDLDEISDAFKGLGYAKENGVQQFALVNAAEANVIRSFRFDLGARFDFIPATTQPGLILTQETVVNGQPPSTFKGLNVIGAYGELLIIEESYIPAGYVAAFASGGEANLNNPIGLRETADPGRRGLLLVKGRTPDYPLIDSYYARGFGTGVRQRGAGLIMKITTSGTYTPPALYA